MKQTHELRAGYGIWELATETEDVILQLKKEGFDLSRVFFFLVQVYQEIEDVDPKAAPLRLYQVKWRSAGASQIAHVLDHRLHQLMPARPAEARSANPVAEWEAIYQYVLMRIQKGVAT
ncbi:MAG: hypothetical protein KAV00_03275 [Phycisphaerae bacterium]|nr:hypothetical protein [Phycisphaerae bacterium]